MGAGRAPTKDTGTGGARGGIERGSVMPDMAQPPMKKRVAPVKKKSRFRGPYGN